MFQINATDVNITATSRYTGLPTFCAMSDTWENRWSWTWTTWNMIHIETIIYITEKYSPTHFSLETSLSKIILIWMYSAARQDLLLCIHFMHCVEKSLIIFQNITRTFQCYHIQSARHAP
jgi:hypothetical protein